jgi:uncharacterized protein DUF3788
LQPNAFLAKSKPPTAKELAAELGRAQALWEQLVADLATEYGVDVREWKSVSPKYGWSLRLIFKKRTIVYLSPHRGSFTASFVLGNKAVKMAGEAGLPPSVIDLINGAKRYAEGAGVRIEVNTRNDLLIVKKLTQIKLEN